MVNKKNNLLICAQKLDKNDDLLGFFHGWVAEFAKQYENVTVVCLFKGEVDLPGNVKVLSLGKENLEVRSKNLEVRSKKLEVRSFKGLLATSYKLLARLRYFFLFYKYIWQERRNYDAVFVHMNPIYVLLGGVFWRVLGKRIGLWYAHGHVPWELQVAEKMVDVIFTSTVGGCRVESGKVRVVGQGVSNFKFQISNVKKIPKVKDQISKVKLITIGRVSVVKDLGSLVLGVGVLVNKGFDVKLDVVGGIGLEKERGYYDSLLVMVKEKGLEERVRFVGAVPNAEIGRYLAGADIFVSASRTGSLDKVFLEAILCGLPVVACNDALLEVIRGYEDKLFYPVGDFTALAERIEGLLKMPAEDIEEMLKELRGVVGREHGVEGLVEKIKIGL